MKQAMFNIDESKPYISSIDISIINGKPVNVITDAPFTYCGDLVYLVKCGEIEFLALPNELTF